MGRKGSRFRFWCRCRACVRARTLGLLVSIMAWAWQWFLYEDDSPGIGVVDLFNAVLCFMFCCLFFWVVFSLCGWGVGEEKKKKKGEGVCVCEVACVRTRTM